MICGDQLTPGGVGTAINSMLSKIPGGTRNTFLLAYDRNALFMVLQGLPSDNITEPKRHAWANASARRDMQDRVIADCVGSRIAWGRVDRAGSRRSCSSNAAVAAATNCNISFH